MGGNTRQKSGVNESWRSRENAFTNDNRVKNASGVAFEDLGTGSTWMTSSSRQPTITLLPDSAGRVRRD
jgi:hypothetical protein